MVISSNYYCYLLLFTLSLGFSTFEYIESRLFLYDKQPLPIYYYYNLCIVMFVNVILINKIVILF